MCNFAPRESVNSHIARFLPGLVQSSLTFPKSTNFATGNCDESTNCPLSRVASSFICHVSSNFTACFHKFWDLFSQVSLVSSRLASHQLFPSLNSNSVPISSYFKLLQNSQDILPVAYIEIMHSVPSYTSSCYATLSM